MTIDYIGILEKVSFSAALLWLLSTIWVYIRVVRKIEAIKAKTNTQSNDSARYLIHYYAVELASPLLREHMARSTVDWNFDCRKHVTSFDVFVCKIKLYSFWVFCSLTSILALTGN